MQYAMQEGHLTLDGEWRDQSVNVLLPPDFPTPGANIVVARDALPLGMTLDQYIAQQRQNFTRQLVGLKMLLDTAGALDGRTAHFLEFSWVSDGKPLHQLMVTVLHEKNALLNFTASCPGAMDAQARGRLTAVLSSFVFAAPAEAP